MPGEGLILAFDIGTTTLKAGLVEVGRFRVIGKSSMPAEVLYPRRGWAEQDVERLWESIASLARELVEGFEDRMGGIVFTAHMAGVVPVDSSGVPLRNALIWLDERAAGYPRSLWRGFPKIYGYNLFKLIKFLRITGGAPGKTGKDPLSKLHWLMDNEPDTFRKTFKFLDIKGYLIARASGAFVTSPDEASLTWLADTRGNRAEWHKGLLKEYNIPLEKLPAIKDSTSIAGGLTRDAARDLGLSEGVPVIVGGGDMPVAGIGSGAVREGEAHIYIGTSDWIAAHHRRRLLDISLYIGSIMSSIPGYYFVVAEQEVAAGALEWFLKLTGREGRYDLVREALERVPPGEANLLFTPWLYGERAPVDDPYLRGTLINISLDSSWDEVIRAIVDGVILNIKWAYNYFEKLVGRQEAIPVIGGGTLFDEWVKGLASALNRPLRRLREPQDAGLRGAAVLASVGTGIYSSIEEAVEHFEYDRTFTPDPKLYIIYNELFRHYISLHKSTRKLFKAMNKSKEKGLHE